MDQLPDVAYPIPPDILTATIEALRDFTLFLEVEAAALARLDSDEARELAQQRLEDAKVSERLFNFYLEL